MGQSPTALHPQTLVERHTEPFALPVQLAQGAIEPQAVTEVPIVHEPPLVQQKPAPQAPASQLAVQVPPEHVGVAPEQLVQASPPFPHAEAESPGAHVFALQQPPLHASAVVHAVEQTPLAGSQASPTGQSFADLHGGRASSAASLPASLCASTVPSGALAAPLALRVVAAAARESPPSLPYSVDRSPKGSPQDTSAASTPRTAAAASKDQRIRVIDPPRTA